MSRGFGKIERGIIEILTNRAREIPSQPGCRAGSLCRGLFYTGFVVRAPTRAELESVRRALRRLAEHGIVKQVPRPESSDRGIRDVFWALTKPPRPKRGRQKEAKPNHRRQRAEAPAAPHQLPREERQRLAKILGLMGSSFSGEREAAVFQAEEIRKKFGLSWEELLR
jgi:hypothetical protein